MSHILSIPKFPRHELRIAHGLSLVHPRLRGWEAFPTPRALAHTRITWALSPLAPQVPGVTPGSLLCPWCFGHSSWRGARHCSSVWSSIRSPLWRLYCPPEILDIIVLVHFQYKFYLIFLTLPKLEKVFGMFILANFFL